MASSSRHLSVHVDRPPAEVCAFVRDPANLPRWSTGVGSAVVHQDGEWFVETPAGRARLRSAPRNAFGVLDHDVLTPAGEEVPVPLRVVADGDGSEVVFTLRPAAGADEAAFERDAGLVGADLARLREVLEAPAG